LNNCDPFSITVDAPEATFALGRRLAPLLTDGDIVLLSGRLGAGKTLFVGGVAEGLGIADPITSPTFVIVKQYEGFLRLTHVDVYRLGRTAELADLDLLDGRGVLVVEWGEAIESSVGPDHLNVRIDHLSETSRTIVFEPKGIWQTRQIETVLL
jgi:tRNA threonylcarbamoyladenosine biosynthesis protein TsaE